MKSTLLKSGVLLAVMTVLLMVATVTAYAATESADIVVADCDHDCQPSDVAAIAVYQVGENDCLEKAISDITNEILESHSPQDGYIVLVIVPTSGHAADDDVTDYVESSGVPITPTTITTTSIEPPTQTAAIPIQQTVSFIETRTAIATASSITAQPQSRVEITTRAEQSGNPLQGADFVVYRVSDNRRVGEVTTDADGEAAISLTAGEYYLRNSSVPYGFLREQARIFFTVGASGDVTVEVTIQRDGDIPYIDDGEITVPKTGELPPVLNYMLGTVFLAFALICGICLLRQRKRNSYKRNNRKGALAYA